MIICLGQFIWFSALSNFEKEILADRLLNEFDWISRLLHAFHVYITRPTVSQSAAWLSDFLCSWFSRKFGLQTIGSSTNPSEKSDMIIFDSC